MPDGGTGQASIPTAFEVADFHIGNAVAPINSWMTAWMLNDVLKMAGFEAEVGDTRPSEMWVPEVDGQWRIDQRYAVVTDAAGWPTSTQLTTGEVADRLNADVLNGLEVPDAFPAGVYRVRYEGEGTLEFTGATVVGTSPGEMRIQYDGRSNVLLHVVETDPQRTGDDLRDVRILRPDAVEGEVFNRAYLEYLRPYAVIRPVHFFGDQLTYGPRVAWSDRKPLDYSHWGGALGAPYELGIDLANQSSSDLWLNVPIAASDDFVERLAALVFARLAPERRLYVELGNELWNFADPYAYGQDYALRQARAEWPGVEGTVRPYSDGDPVNALMMIYSWQGMRTVQVGDIFRAAFGAQSNRVIVVLAGQIGASAPFWHPSRDLLESPVWVGESGGPRAGDRVDAFAVAPYISEPEGGGFSRASASAFIADAARWVRGDAPWSESSDEPGLRYLIRWDKALADAFGLPLIAYEGGQHFTGSRFTRDEVNVHPDMYDLYQTLFDVWTEEGGGLFVHFAGVIPRGQNEPGTEPGYFESENFGIKETQPQTEADAPKWRAVLDAMRVIGQLR